MYDVTIDPDITAQIRRYLLSSVSEYGRSRHTEWMAEDNWIVGYSTSPIEKSFKYDGKFAVVVWKPNRRKDPDRWSIVYYRAFRRRKDAKVRALQLYAKHSPRWAARNGEIEAVVENFRVKEDSNA